jgi:hypothetical protein
MLNPSRTYGSYFGRGHNPSAGPCSTLANHIVKSANCGAGDEPERDEHVRGHGDPGCPSIRVVPAPDTATEAVDAESGRS